MRLILAAAVLALLCGCANDIAYLRCAMVDHDPNRRCT